MSANINQQGFTLVELIITIGLIVALSVSITSLLWDMVTTKSRHSAASTANAHIASLTHRFSRHIQSAKTIHLPDTTTVQLTDDTCRTYRYNALSKSIEVATDTTDPCTPPTSGFSQILPDSFILNSFQAVYADAGNTTLNLIFEGEVKDALTTHPFSFTTTVTQRSTL